MPTWKSTLVRGETEEPPRDAEPRWFHRLERALLRNAVGLGLLLGVAALGLRVWQAHGTFLIADEVLIDGISAQPTLGAVLERAAEHAHPPLFYLLAHVLGAGSRNEMLLRAPWLLLGTAAAVLWALVAGRFLGRQAGLTVLLLLGFSPSLVLLSGEIRQYPLMLFFLAAGLLLFERGVREEGGALELALAAALLGIAVFVHYSAVFVAAACGLAVLVAWGEGKIRPRDLIPWGTVQVAFGVAGWLFLVPHLRALRGGGLEAEARRTWLRSYYFQSGSESLVEFAIRQTVSVFDYLLGDPALAWVGLALFALGLVTLWKNARHLALVAGLPLLLAASAGVADLYPYGGSRHDAFLSPLLAIGIAAALGRLLPAPRPLVAALLLLTPIWAGTASPSLLSAIPRSERGLTLMESAVETMRREFPTESVLFMSRETWTILSRYVDGSSKTGRTTLPTYEEVHLGRWRTLVSPDWYFPSPDQFAREVAEIHIQGRVSRGHRLWIVDAGCGFNLSRNLPRVYPGIQLPGLQTFGRHISFFQTPVLRRPEP